MKNKILTTLGVAFIAQIALAQTGVETATTGFSGPLKWIIYAIVGLMLIITYLLYLVSLKLKRYTTNDPEAPINVAYERRNTWEKLFQLKPLDTDKDTLIDESHDGIYELDNPPPPWFMALFYGSVLFAVVYFVRFSVIKSGMNQDQEYLAEVAQMEAQQVSNLASEDLNIDENSVTQLVAQADIDAGRQIYNQNCKVCHDKDGRGNTGPNLTDEYWKHGGGIKNVYKTIKYGVIEKGMRAWDADLNPKMMQQVSSYILSLQGTNPEGAKGPEGEKWVAPAEDAPASKDSSATGNSVAVN